MSSVVKEIRYETPMEHINFAHPTIFLAGPTVRGNQPHLTSWRFEAVRLLQERVFLDEKMCLLNIIIPEFTDITQSDKYRYDIPIWERTGLIKSDVILFWVPRTRELIGLTTNHEHGYWMARDRRKMVYGRPDDAYRVTYLDIMWVEDAKNNCWSSHIDIYDTLPKTVKAAMELLNNLCPNKR
jgi:hypothetical protein